MKLLFYLTIAPMVGTEAERIPPPTHEVEALIRRLDAPTFAARHAAEHKLCRFGVGVVPLLMAEVQNNWPLEVRQRLVRIIDHYTKLPWHLRLEEGLAEAKKTGKRIVVLAGRRNDTNALAMVDQSFQDPRLVRYLKQHYVVVWNDGLGGLEALLADREVGVRRPVKRLVKEGAGRGSLRSYFCNPDGIVDRYLDGYRGAERVLQAAKNIAVPPGERELMAALDDIRFRHPKNDWDLPIDAWDKRDWQWYDYRRPPRLPRRPVEPWMRRPMQKRPEPVVSSPIGQSIVDVLYPDLVRR